MSSPICQKPLGDQETLALREQEATGINSWAETKGRKLTLYKLWQALLCILNPEGNILSQRTGIILQRQILQSE